MAAAATAMATASEGGNRKDGREERAKDTARAHVRVLPQDRICLPSSFGPLDHPSYLPPRELAPYHSRRETYQVREERL